MKAGAHRFTARDGDAEEHWISISDLMTGLMVIFMFIAISYMLVVRADKEQIERIAVTYEKLQGDLYADLEDEFASDLDDWNAVLDRDTLAIRFKEPEVLFGQGETDIRLPFARILDDFFPRYLAILRKPDYIADIAEVRIEGHTSSEWSATATDEEAYILNMDLSQGRTRSVLEYALRIPEIQRDIRLRDWLRSNLTANGLSSSKLILGEDGHENDVESRRVEFRVRTNAEKRIVEIINRRKDGE
jgi:outer membrane protein OmpA-like peptidoglycan-associated protein